MSISNSPSFRNELLRSLDPKDLAQLLPHLRFVELPKRKLLEHPNNPIQEIYFLERGVASVVMIKGAEAEAGMMGYEGCTGLAVIAGDYRSPFTTYIQLDGDGYSIGADDFRAALENSPALRRKLHLYAHCFMIQVASTAMANVLANAEQRLARWLLMAHDRTEGDSLPVTHEVLAVMLGTRRPGVTATIRPLITQKILAARRGEVVVLDRASLEDRAGKFYGIPEDEYRRVMNRKGQPGSANRVVVSGKHQMDVHNAEILPQRGNRNRPGGRSRRT